MNQFTKRLTADEIAELADSGRDISEFFSNQGTMKPPLLNINFGRALDLSQEFDQFAVRFRRHNQVSGHVHLKRGQRITQKIGKLNHQQAVIKSHLLYTLSQQPWFNVFR